MALSIFTLFLPFFLGFSHHIVEAAEVSFDKNYVVWFGYDHVSQLHDRKDVQLSLDKASGAGFKSKRGYCSGFFEINIKLPEQRSPGPVTTFYLTSNGENQPGNHDEIDFEFLGTDGPPFILQTNLFADDNGGREQRHKLWFDPTKHFHKYGILWNHHQIVLFVDDIPIRVYKNNKKFGARYPTNPTLFVEGSIWNGDNWASGGRRIDWSKAPFQVHYQGFNINGSESGGNCYSHIFWWNGWNYWQLTPDQQRQYEDFRKKYLIYDYCSDRGQFYKECQLR